MISVWEKGSGKKQELSNRGKSTNICKENLKLLFYKNFMTCFLFFI